MSNWNTHFELNITDILLVEDALRKSITRTTPEEHKTKVHALLGKIHNQKIWYDKDRIIPKG